MMAGNWFSPTLFWKFRNSLLSVIFREYPFIFWKLLFLENHVFLSFSVHFNESALMEMFIWTVRSFYVFMKNSVLTDKNQSDLSCLWKHSFSFSLCKWQIPSCEDWRQRLLFSGHMLLFSGHRHSYFLEIAILVLLVPSDADDDDDDNGGGGVPTTLPAWQVPGGITHRDQISRSGNPSLW